MEWPRRTGGKAAIRAMVRYEWSEPKVKKVTLESTSDRSLLSSHKDRVEATHLDLQDSVTNVVPIKVMLTFRALLS